MGKESELLQLVKVEDVPGVTRLLSKLRANKPKLLGTGRRMNINAQDAEGMCALHQTALLGNTALMSLLLESGAAVDVRDARGMRPLHFAAWQGHAPLVTLLLQWNASVNEGAADGNAPLHLAAQYGHLEAAHALLVRFHANPALRNKDHRTPFDLAAEFGRLHIVELFLSSNKCLSLLEESPEDTLDNSRTTCLHLAAKNGHLDVIRAVLRSGMNVNRSTLRGTALHEAALYGRFTVVKLLIESGVDVNKPNSYDQTALDILRTMTSSSRAGRDIRQLLKEACSAVQAVSLKDHLPSDPLGLALLEGDYVTVLEQKEDGRWRGVVFGENGTSRSGFFPSAAVALLNRQVGGMSSGSQQQQQRPKSSLAKKVAPPVVPGHNPPLRSAVGTPPSGNRLGTEMSDQANGMYISMSSGSCTSSPVYSTTPSHHVGQVFMSPRGQPNSPHPSDEGSISSSASTYAPSYCHPLPPPAYHHQTSLDTDQGIDVQSPGRDSPSSSGSSSGSGCRHSITSLDSGRASSSAYDGGRGVAYAAANQQQQQQQRLSVHSYESSTSLRQSYHSSTSSLGSMDRVLDENTPTSPNYSPAQINVSKLLRDGLPEAEVLRRWLCEQRFEEYFHLFIQSGYDIPTISRMTPEDLTAIGITNPSHRKKLKVEIGKLNVSDGLPDFIPNSLDEWLRLLRLEEYAVCLQQQGYNKVTEVQGIAWEDLEEIGIQRLGHQKKIMLAIKRLKDIQSGIKRFSCTGGGALGESPSQQQRPAQPLEVKCQVISPPNIPFQQPYIECSSDSPVVVLSGATTPNAYSSPSHLIYRPDIVAIQVRHPSGARSLENLEENNREMRHQTFLQTTDNNNRWTANNQNNLMLNQTVSFQVNNSSAAALGAFQGGASPQMSTAWRRGSLDDGDLTPTNEFVYEVEGGGTLPRPKVSIKPRPVAKIMAKTRLSNGDGGAVLARSEETIEIEDLKGGGVESCVTIAEVHNSPRRSMTGINTSACTFRNGKKVPPPPPPKRSNSMNEKQQQQQQQQQRASCADYSNEQLFATCVKSMASKFGLSTRKSRPDCCSGDGEGMEVERKVLDSPGTPSDEGSDLSLEISEAPDRTPPSPAPGSPVHLRSHSNNNSSRASPFLNKRNESTSSLASTNSSSSNSSSSGGSSETGGTTNLPFANENVGTIKQRAIKPHPPLTKIDLGPRLSNPNNAVVPRSAPVTPKRRSSLRSCDMTPSVVVTPPVSGEEDRCEELEVGVASSDVLSDIDNMLANLSEELDAMLTSQLSE